MVNRLNLLVAAACGAAVLLSQAVPGLAQAGPDPKAKPKDAPRVTRKPESTPAAKDRAKEAKEDAQDRVKEAKDDAKDRRKDAKDDAREDAKDRAQDKAKDRAKDAKDAAKEAREDAQENTRNARQVRKFDAAKVKTDDLGVAFKENDKEVVLSNITKESVLANAGFRAGDHIVSINGKNLVRQNDFVTYLFASNATTGRIPVVVMRNGTKDTLYVRPTTIIREYERVVVDDRPHPIRAFGLVLDNRNDDRLIVDRVIKDSRADHAGIQVDDEILALNDRDVESRQELARMLEKYDQEKIELEVRRDRAAKIIEVKALR